MIELWANRYVQCNDDIINRIDVDFVRNNCTFGDIGQLNLAFRDFNSSWHTQLGYTKNFTFKPGTVNVIKDIMTHSLFLQNAQKKAMKTIFNNFTDQRWRMNRLRQDYERLNDKLVNMRNSGFQITDFEEEVVEIPNKFKEAMDNWNNMLTPLNARVGIMSEITENFSAPTDNQLHFVFTMEIPNIILQVYNREDDTSKKMTDIPLNGGARIGWCIRLAQAIDNFGTISADRTIRSNYYGAYSFAEKIDISRNITHPFINRTMNGNCCTGDLAQTLRDHFTNFRFMELLLTCDSWMTNFEFGRTYPLNPLANSFFGMPKAFGEDFANKVGQDTGSCATRMLDEYKYFDTTAKECDNMECTLRDKCNGYEVYNDTIRQKEQREREERALQANKWIDEILEQYDVDENGSHMYVDEEMYEWLYDTALTHGKDGVEMAILSCYHDRMIRDILNGICKGGFVADDWASIRNEWGDIYAAIINHPDYETDNDGSNAFHPYIAYDAFSFLNLLLISDGVDGVQDFIIESLELYHEKVIKLKPTKISRKFDNNVSDERIKREMEEWAAAMGVPQEEGRPIMPEQSANTRTRDIVEEPIDRPWNPLESIELDDNDDPIF